MPTALTELRVARPADIAPLRALIAASVRGLRTGYYTEAQAESALRHVFGVDSQLIADRTYFVIQSGETLVAAGGWSKRRTLFGGDQAKEASDPLLDPAREPARIRAFFVHPEWARQGLARRLFEACQTAAHAAGFTTFELMATLPGEPLYSALGFVAHERVDVPLPDGLTLPCVRMTRLVGPVPV